jgi:hypothetical protein
MNYLNKIYPLPIFILFIVLLLFLTNNGIHSVNDASRFLTMESLVERGTFALNEKHLHTTDKIKRGENFYSSKPPVLSVMGAGIYYILYHFFNLNFPNKTNYFFSPSLAVYLINLILVDGAFVLLLFYFYKTLNLFNLERKYKTLLIFGLGLGTLYLPYSTTLNNHTIAGSFLFISFYYLLKIKSDKSNHQNIKKYLLLSGFFVSLSAVIDLPTGLSFVFLFFVCFYYQASKRNENSKFSFPSESRYQRVNTLFFKFSKKYLIYYVLPILPIILIHLFFNLQITGDFLPAQFHREYGVYEGSYWNQPQGIDAVRHSTWLYSFNILLGSHGLFFYSPILLFSLYATYKIIREKNHKFQNETFLIWLGFLIILLFYVIKFRGYGGTAYGFRWFIAITPLIYFLSILHFFQKPSDKFINIFTLVLILSIGLSIVGLYNTWSVPCLTIKTPQGDIINVCFPFLSNLYQYFI